ncbi:FMN-binding protein MioC [Celerinatantimonas yamalensis]|uniref:FMN-binding protein MioC n=1 Tax=Celerinatantimonas yamalensis TaxID=559956 RepID=A0ABW9GA69_9GAMM
MEIDLIVGSMMGAAEYVADELEQELIDSHQVTQHLDADLEELPTDGSHIWLICTSTHGAGDYPDNIEPFIEQLKAQRPNLSRLKYGVIALGSSQYDTFCQAGRNIDQLLGELGANRIGERLEIDAQIQPVPEDSAIEWLPNWRQQLEAQ